MPIAVLGVSHHTASVEVRERFAFGAAERLDFVRDLHALAGGQDAVLLSTCNRTELYLYPASEESLQHAEVLLQRKAGPLPAPVTEFLYLYRREEVAQHLFRVTAGLDSLVPGEAEIQGQVRVAYESARVDADGEEERLAASVLHRLFQTALSVGGRVRSQTAISAGAASVASVAVELARKIFGDLEGRKAMVLGAGEAAQLVVQALGRFGVDGIVVANRTYEKAARLAETLCGSAIEIEDIARALPKVDIVVASSGAPHAIVTRRTLAEAFPDGPPSPLLFIDIAIPRDVDPEVGSEPNVFIYNIDDLRTVVDETLERRRGAIEHAERIITEATGEFMAWYASREVVPIIRSLRSRGEEIRQAEVDRLLQRLGAVEGAARSEIETFSRRLLNKLLHEPTVRVKEEAAGGRAVEAAEAARMLFGVAGTGFAPPPESGEGTGEEPPAPPLDSTKERDGS